MAISLENLAQKKKKRPWETFDPFTKEYRTTVLEATSITPTFNITPDDEKRSLVRTFMCTNPQKKKMGGILSLIKELLFN